MKTIGLLCASICLFAQPIQDAVATESEKEGIADVRGITLSTHRGGRELGDPEVLGPSLQKIRETGAT